MVVLKVDEFLRAAVELGCCTLYLSTKMSKSDKTLIQGAHHVDGR